MTKEEKLVVINNLAEQLEAYPHFYITDIEALNAEQTATLRRKCFENDVKLVVVKNTLFTKALEKVEKADADLVKVLEGSTSVMFAETGKAPAVLIKEFRKKNDKPVTAAGNTVPSRPKTCIGNGWSGAANHQSSFDDDDYDNPHYGCYN